MLNKLRYLGSTDFVWKIFCEIVILCQKENKNYVVNFFNFTFQKNAANIIIP